MKIHRQVVQDTEQTQSKQNDTTQKSKKVNNTNHPKK